MFFKLKLVLLVYCIVEIHSGCVCRDKSTSPCSSGASYVRPQPKQKVLAAKSTVCKTVGAQEYKPVGDTCSCGVIKVAPASPDVPAKSSCTKCNKKQRKEEKDRSSSPYHGTQYDITDTQFDEAENVYDPDKGKDKDIKADSISIVLASEQRDRCNQKVPEAKLHYGPSGKIEDGSTRKLVQDLNEGGLYEMKGTRLSLKKCRKHDVDDDDDGDISDEQDADNIDIHNLKYDEIGFDDAKFSRPRYVKEYVRHKSHECKDNKNEYRTETVEREGSGRSTRVRGFSSRDTSREHVSREVSDESDDDDNDRRNRYETFDSK